MVFSFSEGTVGNAITAGIRAIALVSENHASLKEPFTPSKLIASAPFKFLPEITTH